MNEFKRAFKGAAGCIVTDRDIVGEAAQRASQREAQSCAAGRKVRKLRPAVCALLAAAMVFGTGFSAVKYGWLNVVFGDSGNVILENPEQYSLEISGLETECRLPGTEVSVNDVVCDGEAMYVSLTVNGLSAEKVDTYYNRVNVYPKLTAGDGSWKGYNQSFGIRSTAKEEDSVSLYACLFSGDGIDLGDKIDLCIFDLDDDLMDRPENDYDFRIAFDVAKQPSDIAIFLEPDRKVTLDSGMHDCGMIMNIESIRISPLTYDLTATKLSSDDYNDFFDVMMQTIPVLVMKDGSRISLPCDSHSGSLDGDDIYHFYALFNRVIPIDDLAGIEIGDSYIEVTR